MEQDTRTVELDEGWRFIATNLAKARRAIDNEDDGESITPQEYMQLYTTVYSMCTQAPPHNYSEQLYQRYKDDLDDYIKSTVLPSLREMDGENLMRGLVERWRKYNLIVTWQISAFRYLQRYYIRPKSLPTIKQVGASSFHHLVFNELKYAVTTTAISMIDDERDGQLIDRDLLKNVLDIYVQIGSGRLEIYQVDFEDAFRQGTRNYYSSKAQTWILEYSHSEYMIKVEGCLQNEKERTAHYLHSSTEPKIVEDVRFELITTRSDLQKEA